MSTTTTTATTSSSLVSSSPPLGWDTVPIMCINLDRRPDRLAAVTTQLQRLGRRFDDRDVHTLRLSATDCTASDGALGCSLSHLACLDRAIAEKWPAVVVLEDDFVCTQPAVLRRNVDAFLERAHTGNFHWDVLLLGANVRLSAQCGAASFGDTVHRVRRAFSTVAYLVRAAYLPTLRENVSAGIQLLTGRPHLRHQYAIDVHWQRLQMRHAWFVCAPLTVTQQPGHSDIENQDVDYAELLLRGHEAAASSFS